MNPFELMNRLRKACPCACQVEISTDVDPMRLRVQWDFRMFGQSRSYSAVARQDLDEDFDFDAWLEAVSTLMRKAMEKMVKDTVDHRIPWRPTNGSDSMFLADYCNGCVHDADESCPLILQSIMAESLDDMPTEWTALDCTGRGFECANRRYHVGQSHG